MMLFIQSCVYVDGRNEEISETNLFYDDNRNDVRYKILSVGKKQWFKENLKLDTQKNEELIRIQKNTSENSGFLYTYAIALQGCPVGWHLSTDEEWMELEKSLGMKEEEIQRMGVMRGFEGSRMYGEGIEKINIRLSNTIAIADNILTIKNNNLQAGFWTSTLSDHKDSAYVRIVYPALNIARVKISLKNDSSLFYVRCVKD